MKKALILLLSAAALAGCKKESSETPQPADSTAVSLTAADSLPQKKCLRTIVIDYDKVNQTTWNSSYECTPDTMLPPCDETSAKCTHTKKYVNLDLIMDGTDPRGDASLIKQSNWLKENKNSICYIETEPYIAQTHLVEDKGLIKEIEDVLPNKWTPFTEQQIKDAIQSAGGDYANDKYDHYLRFRKPGSTLQLEGVAGYSITDHGYSVPLLRAINTCNDNFYSDNRLYFTPLKGTHFVRIYIKDPSDPMNKVARFYDYSKLPDAPDSPANPNN